MYETIKSNGELFEQVMASWRARAHELEARLDQAETLQAVNGVYAETQRLHNEITEQTLRLQRKAGNLVTELQGAGLTSAEIKALGSGQFLLPLLSANGGNTCESQSRREEVDKASR